MTTAQRVQRHRQNQAAELKRLRDENARLWDALEELAGRVALDAAACSPSVKAALKAARAALADPR
jgi:hypothetical protein